MRRKLLSTEETEELREKYRYDRAGCVRYRKTFGKNKCGNIAGYKDQRGYSRITFRGGKILVHRLVYLLCTGEQPECIDHINRDKGDNRIENLRACNYSQNKRNVSYKNCRFKKGKWEAYTNEKGKFIYLGLYKTESEAKDAYKKYGEANYGEFFTA